VADCEGGFAFPDEPERGPAVGKRVMSTPISAMMHSAARLSTPVMVSRWSRAAERDHQRVDLPKLSSSQVPLGFMRRANSSLRGALGVLGVAAADQALRR
jgi:hypothetical protein